MFANLVGATIPAILQVLPSIARAIASTVITDKDTLQFIDVAFGIVNAGVQVPEKLKALDEEIAGFVARGEAPSGNWWTEYRERSLLAHQDIQTAAKQTEEPPEDEELR